MLRKEHAQIAWENNICAAHILQNVPFVYARNMQRRAQTAQFALQHWKLWRVILAWVDWRECGQNKVRKSKLIYGLFLLSSILLRFWPAECSKCPENGIPEQYYSYQFLYRLETQSKGRHCACILRVEVHKRRERFSIYVMGKAAMPEPLVALFPQPIIYIPCPNPK